jgi:hypothetical protein
MAFQERPVAWIDEKTGRGSREANARQRCMSRFGTGYGHRRSREARWTLVMNKGSETRCSGEVVKRDYVRGRQFDEAQVQEANMRSDLIYLK